MADQPGIDLKRRLEVLWRLQSSARECLAYVTSLGAAAAKLGDAINDHHIFTSLYVNNARSALLLASHLVEDDKQSVSAKSTAHYAKTHLSEFVRFHSQNSSRSEQDRNTDLVAVLDCWFGKFSSEKVTADIMHVRDWTLAHTDRRSITRQEDVPGVPFAEVRQLLDMVNDFVNDLLIRIEDRGLESGQAFLEPDIRNEVLDTVARLTIITEIFAKEIEEQGMGPALIRMAELKKALGEASNG